MIEQSEKKTALYCRLSRDDELEGERQMLEQYAMEHGFQNPEFYVDDGISGTTFDRPGFKRMLAEVDADQVGAVIVKDLSRFGRDYVTVGFYTETVFPEHSVRFIAINNGVDSAVGENDKMPFINVFNEWHARDTSKKVRAVKEYQGKSGEHLCTIPPYGYRKDPESPKKWIVDEEAAKVVRWIFAQCMDGYGPSQIARMLRERKVLTPSAYSLANGRRPMKTPEDNYAWAQKSISDILQQDAYTGCTINFKTHRVSYKDKKIRLNPPEKQIIFENTQEAIIDKATWDRVQQIRKNKRRPTKSGKSSIFSGLLFCGDCGGKMYFATCNHFSPNQEHFVCANSRKNLKPCSTHYIRECVLHDLVLEHLRQTLLFARADESEFVRMLGTEAVSEQKKELSAKRRELAKAQLRIQELDRLFQRIYEDNVNEKLSDERFAKLSDTYTTEQKDLETRIGALNEDLSQQEHQVVNVEGFLKLVRKYTEIPELNATILNEFIDRILVYAPEKIDGKRIQKITIQYNFVGEIPEQKESVVA